MKPSIAVIGDVILDTYDYVTVRENPESSAPCYTVVSTDHKPGGAGNVAANLVALGADVTLFGVRGNDPHGALVEEVLQSCGISHSFVVCSERPTIIKRRIIDSTSKTYYARVDYEKVLALSAAKTNELLAKMDAHFDCIIISDYAKGVMTQALVEGLKKLGKPLFVDTKPKNLQWYKDVFVLKPNLKEALAMTQLEDPVLAGKKLVELMQSSVLLTRSKDGMTLFEKGATFHVPAYARDVVDVTGAGDTVIATLAHYYSLGYSLPIAMQYANIAACIAVGHSGCYHVRVDEITDFIKKNAVIVK